MPNSDDQEEINERELFDISDVKVEIIPRKNTKEAFLHIKGRRTLGLMRYYLSIRAHLHQIELELGIYEESDQR